MGSHPGRTHSRPTRALRPGVIAPRRWEQVAHPCSWPVRAAAWEGEAEGERRGRVGDRGGRRPRPLGAGFGSQQRLLLFTPKAGPRSQDKIYVLRGRWPRIGGLRGRFRSSTRGEESLENREHAGKWDRIQTQVSLPRDTGRPFVSPKVDSWSFLGGRHDPVRLARVNIFICF